MEEIRRYPELYATAGDKEDAIDRLCNIVAVLRKECPWDKVQTHESLTRGMIEEAYEAVEAINNHDMANLREELGDVLLQVIFHATLGEESGNFNITDIINEECEKMIRRHPHVFLEEIANNNVKSIDKVLERWENTKVRERGEQNCASRMKAVPKVLPALIRAGKVQAKAAAVGFDWKDASGAFEKVNEETSELRNLCNDGITDSILISEELGDLLFSVVNVSRFLSVDAEDALNYATDKFIRRFSYIEEKALACGRSLTDMSLSEMDELWNVVKSLERSE